MSLLDNLISYWKLDEASGDAVDAHGSNTLTETGGAISSVTGVINTARQGSVFEDRYFTHADNADLSFGDEDMTMCFWGKVPNKSTDSTQIFMCKGDIGTAATHDYGCFWSQSADRFLFRVSDGTSLVDVTANSFGAPTADTWYFIRCFHDSVGNQIGISINDGTVDTTSHSTGINNTGANFRFMADDSGGRIRFVGMDEAGLWRRKLSSAEGTSLYNSGAGLAYPFPSGATTLEQHSYRWKNNDGNEAAATFRGALNTQAAIGKLTPVRCRILANQTGG